MAFNEHQSSTYAITAPVFHRRLVAMIQAGRLEEWLKNISCYSAYEIRFTDYLDEYPNAKQYFSRWIESLRSRGAQIQVS
jgi:hypothetical protein